MNEGAFAFAFRLYQFIGIDALELGVALHLPELGYLDAGGVELQGCAHRRVELGVSIACHEDEQGLVFQRVNGVDDVVVGIKFETIGGLGGKELMTCGNLGVRIDGEQTLLEDSLMPERTKLSAHQEPTPPTPKSITRFSAMRLIASSPNNSSDL